MYFKKFITLKTKLVIVRIEGKAIPVTGLEGP
jgi:hypothetical protein